MQAASNGHIKTVQILVDADADVDSEDNQVSAGADGIGCLSGADLVVCGAGRDCAGPCKAVQAHTDRPTTYEVNSMHEMPCEILHNRAQMVTINYQLRGVINHQ